MGFKGRTYDCLLRERWIRGLFRGSVRVECRLIRCKVKCATEEQTERLRGDLWKREISVEREVKKAR